MPTDKTQISDPHPFSDRSTSIGDARVLLQSIDTALARSRVFFNFDVVCPKEFHKLIILQILLTANDGNATEKKMSRRERERKKEEKKKEEKKKKKTKKKKKEKKEKRGAEGKERGRGGEGGEERENGEKGDQKER